MSKQNQEPKSQESETARGALLERWLVEGRDMIAERAPEPADREQVHCQLAELASSPQSTVVAGSAVPTTEALALWRLLDQVLEAGPDLFADEADAGAALAQFGASEAGAGMEPGLALALARNFLASAGGPSLTPAAFAARLRRGPPDSLELPDGVALTGDSLAAFLESAHFPYGRYRIGEVPFFVTPSLRLGAETLEALARSGRGARRVGRQMLLWQPASFRVAAGTAADGREARPFVGPSGARAYLWLGPALPGGPLVLRDANGVETRIPVLDSEEQEDRVLHVADPAKSKVISPLPETKYAIRTTPDHPPLPAALRRAEEALRAGNEGGMAERCLREVMRSPGASGEALAGAGRLWQAMGKADVARAAFLLALERGSAEGALGLSRLAEAMGEGLEAAARPLDAAIARNLRSAELHARYAELLGRRSSGWETGPLVEWHRRQAECLEPGMRDEE